MDVSVSSFGLYRWLAVAGDAAPASHGKSAFLDGFGSAGFTGCWQLDFADGFWGWQAVTARGSRLFRHDGSCTYGATRGFRFKIGPVYLKEEEEGKECKERNLAITYARVARNRVFYPTSRRLAFYSG